MENLIGQSLDRYQIVGLLGEGGMGAVFRAHDTKLDRDVAIKVMHPHLARQPDFRARFLQEARTAARMSHPGIVRVHDFGETTSHLYIVMEFIPGTTLRHMLQELKDANQWIILSEALRLVRQVSLALDYAHRQGVLHRDVKPNNIMIKPEPTDGLSYRPVLTDLGLAKLAEGGLITQAGISLGTPAYMSPEHARGERTDARSDVYSLGILLYELTVGRLPFPVKTITEAIRYHTQEPPPLPRSVRPDLPAPVERVILRALAKDPAGRFPDARALAEALFAALPETEAAAIPPTTLEAVSLTTHFHAADTVAEAVPPADTMAEAPSPDSVVEPAPLADTVVESAPPADTVVEPAPSADTVVRVPSPADAVVEPAPALTVTTRPAEIFEPPPQAQEAWEPLPRQQTTKFWLPLLLTIIGWSVSWFSGAILSVLLMDAFVWELFETVKAIAGVGMAEFIMGLLIPFTIRGVTVGAVGGLITGLALRWAAPTIRGKQVLIVTLGWIICWTAGAIAFAFVMGMAQGMVDLVLWGILGAIVGIVGGSITGQAMRQAEPSVEPLAIALGWTIAWASGEVIVSWFVDHGVLWPLVDWIAGLGVGDVSLLLVRTVFLGFLASAIGGGIMFWHLNRVCGKG